MAKTEIAFVSGFDPVCPTPSEVKPARLTHRLAVIQETYRPDCVDMFFDARLFRALMRFATQFEPGAVVTVDEKDDGHEVDLATFLSMWELRSEEEKGPDAKALVRVAGELVACIAPEHWANIGGPMPYHDSYTYSIFTQHDVSGRVMAFLAKDVGASGWQLASEIVPAPDRPPKSWLQRLLKW